MDQMTIKRNEDNDLKYRQGLYNPPKENKDDSSINEAHNTADEKLEYFTE